MADFVISSNFFDNFALFVQTNYMPNEFDCVVGILRGGAALATVASNILNIPMYVVSAQRYTDRVGGKVMWEWGTASVARLRGKRILIVEDIIDEGKTMEVVLRRLKKCNPLEVHILVLVSKNEMFCRENGVRFLHEVSKDMWVIFPWEKRRVEDENSTRIC